MFVKTILKTKGREVFTTPPATPIADAAQMLVERNIGAMPVMNQNGDIVGIISERDVVRAIAQSNGTLKKLTVQDIMTRDVITCSPDNDIADVMNTMTENRVRHLPVMNSGKLHGLISIGDVMKHRLEEIQHEEINMREYIAGAGY